MEAKYGTLTKKTEIELIESVQRKAVRFICNIKGRQESLTPVSEKLGLEATSIRRMDSQIALLLKIILVSSSETPGAISAKFPELDNINNINIITRSRSENQPAYLATKKLLPSQFPTKKHQRLKTRRWIRLLNLLHFA